MANNFPYTRGVPNPPNNPSNDVTPMQTNTNSIDSLIKIDHISFNTSGSGIHKQVTLKNESAPGLGDGNGVLFANLANGNSWPFWQNSSGTSALFGQNSIGANGYTTIPGGIILQWGSITGSPIANGATVSFPKTFTNLFSITLGPASNSTADKTMNITTGSPSTTGFTVSCSGSSSFQTLYWMAIGN